jgi:hypothetical protein
MPPHIRAILTGVVIVTAIVLWLFRETISLGSSTVLYFAVAAAMAGALWMFPEVKKGPSER